LTAGYYCRPEGTVTDGFVSCKDEIELRRFAGHTDYYSKQSGELTSLANTTAYCTAEHADGWEETTWWRERERENLFAKLTSM